tara:strand:- start:858 stop:1028 length:171 start_codon:yes stop_codon:yes gene_type:complete
VEKSQVPGVNEQRKARALAMACDMQTQKNASLESGTLRRCTFDMAIYTEVLYTDLK